MSYSWKDRLRSLKQRIFGRRQPPTPTRVEEIQTVSRPTLEEGVQQETPPRSFLEEAPRERASSQAAVEAPKQQIAINLGIDFGTSFTKACFRDVGREHSGIITFRGRSLQSALVPSVVYFDRDGKLYREPRFRSDGCTPVRYLKMRLAGVPIEDGSSQALASYGDIDELSRALSSWFLAMLMRDCQQWLAEHERDRLKNRHIVWSANVGVPVEHYDSDKLKVFDEVLAVAWLWIKQGTIPADVASALKAYGAARSSVVPGEIDCHAFPEIAAAVQSFIISREARPGIYIYFDVGGGTVDGVAFDFVGHNGERRVNFYSGKVAPLGVSALLTRLGSNGSVSHDHEGLDRLLRTCDRVSLCNVGDDLQRLVAKVIVTAKRKDPRDWRIDDIQVFGTKKSSFKGLKPSNVRPLVIFVGGGGSRSRWYKETIESTHGEFKHSSMHIPPYSLTAVPRPKDLDMGRIGGDAFDRFAVAYGLSIPFGEGPDIGLPSQFENAPPLPQWQPPGGVSYENSKDAYD
jgi:hypothetical protein